jgi:hypothetical protein
MNKKKIVVLILAMMIALVIGLPLAFAKGGGGHGGGGHASGHAGGEGGHGGEGEGHSSSSHSEEETHTVPRTYYTGHGSSYQELCPHGVEKTEDHGASGVAVTCKDEGINRGDVALGLFLVAIIAVVIGSTLGS